MPMCTVTDGAVGAGGTVIGGGGVLMTCLFSLLLLLFGFPSTFTVLLLVDVQ